MKGLIKYELKNMFSLWWLVYATALLLAFFLLEWREDYHLFVAVASIHISNGIGDTTRADEKSGWLALQGILPVSKRQYLTAKYIRFGIVSVLNFCFVFTLIGIRCALNGTFGFLTFWLPLLLYLSFYMGMGSLFPDITRLKGRGLRSFLIKNGSLISGVGNGVSFLVLVSNPNLGSRILPFVIGLLVIGAVAFILNIKVRLDQFEDYQLGIPSELQRE